MKKSLLVILLLPVFACAQSAFDGTWRFEFPRPKPHRVMLRGDILRIPDLKINVKADGTDQPAQGLQSYDTIAAKVVDDKTVQMTYKKNGKIVASQKDTVSADGKMLTREITYPDPGNQPDTPKFTFIRAAAGASGSHAISGTWIQQIPTTYAIRYKGSPEGLTMLTPTGEPASDAKFDGKDYPVKGPDAARTVSLKKVNDRSIDLTIKHEGKIVNVNHMTVSADGKTLTVKAEAKAQNDTRSFTFTKQ